jgi:hypothetical protein
MAAIANSIIVVVALYRRVDMYKGPFAALIAVGVVMASLADVMFMLAFRRGNRKRLPGAPHLHSLPPPSPPPPRSAPIVLPAVLPLLPANVSLFDVLKHGFSTRVAGSGDRAVDATVQIMGTGSKSALFGRWRSSRWSAYFSGAAGDRWRLIVATLRQSLRRDVGIKATV